MRFILGAIAALFFCIGHFLRTMRWRITIGNRYSFTKLFKRLSISYLLNMLIPLRLGEVVRIIPDRGRHFRVTALFSSLVYERLIDIILVSSLLILISTRTDEILYLSAGNITWLVIISASLFPLFYTRKGLQILLYLRLPGPIEDYWAKFLYENQQISRKVNSAKNIYILLTFLMWSSYIIAVFAFTKFLDISFFSGVNGLYGNLFEAPLYFVSKSASRETAIITLSMITVPILLVIIVSRFSNLSSYDILRKSEMRFTQSIPLPAVLFSADGLREYILSIREKKINLLEESSKIFDHEIRFLKDLGGGSGASTYIISHLSKPDTSVIKMSNEFEIMSRLEIQYKHLKKLDQMNVPVIKVNNLYIGIPNLVAYDMTYNINVSDFHRFILQAPVGASINLLQRLMNSLSVNIYGLNKEFGFQYRETFDYYYESKISRIFEDLQDYFDSFSKDDKIIINDQVYLTLNKDRFNRWLSNYGIVGAGCVGIHGDLTFQNMLINNVTQELLLIDTNPMQNLQHPSVDIGKILQSLRLRYELFDMCDLELSVSGCTIKYKLPDSKAYSELEASISEWLFTEKMKSDYVDLIAQSEAQYGLHLLRLLPYKLRNDPQRFPIFYAELVKFINPNR